jgi:hypothetical protein
LPSQSFGFLARAIPGVGPTSGSESSSSPVGSSIFLMINSQTLRWPNLAAQWSGVRWFLS